MATEAEATNEPSTEVPSTEAQDTGVDTSEMSAAQLADLNAKLYGEVKGLRVESKDRRLKLEAYEKAELKTKEAELSALEKLALRETEITDLKTQMAYDRVATKAISKLVSAGFDEKLVRVALPKDLTEETVDSVIKDFAKEWKDHLSKATAASEVSEKPSPLASFQPKGFDTPAVKNSDPTDRAASYLLKSDSNM